MTKQSFTGTVTSIFESYPAQYGIQFDTPVDGKTSVVVFASSPEQEKIFESGQRFTGEYEVVNGNVVISSVTLATSQTVTAQVDMILESFPPQYVIKFNTPVGGKSSVTISARELTDEQGMLVESGRPFIAECEVGANGVKITSVKSATLSNVFNGVVKMVINECSPPAYVIEFSSPIEGHKGTLITGDNLTAEEVRILESGKPFKGEYQVTENKKNIRILSIKP